MDETLQGHEELTGLHPLSRTDNETVHNIFNHELLRLNLNAINARGQCFDRAATVIRCKTGVAEEPKALNTSNTMLWTRFKSCCKIFNQKCQ